MAVDLGSERSGKIDKTLGPPTAAVLAEAKREQARRYERRFGELAPFPRPRE